MNCVLYLQKQRCLLKGSKRYKILKDVYMIHTIAKEAGAGASVLCR